MEHGARAPGQSGMLDYWAQKNVRSLDGLPGLQQGIRFAESLEATLPPGYIGSGEAQKWRRKEVEEVKKGHHALYISYFDWFTSTQTKMVLSFLFGVALTVKFQPYIATKYRG